VGVETGVFLLCFAADEAVAAVTEALIGFGCFLGDPPSVTVGPTDCERPTKKRVSCCCCCCLNHKLIALRTFGNLLGALLWTALQGAAMS